jgi:TIR domain
MNSSESRFQLPRAIEQYMAALSGLYARQGKRKKQKILVNSQVRVHEEWHFDNWNGGISGHALYFALPAELYVSVIGQKDQIQSQIKTDFNKMHNFQDEVIAQVFLEMEAIEDHDWRKDSGLLRSGKRFVLPGAEKRIWGEEGFRLFLSHKSDVKKETAELKDRLHLFGLSCFVAHQDIHPIKAWQDEIEIALGSMEGFVALLTDNFHDSDWTDQEVGFAFARGVPIIAVRLGKDPYGFIGKFQALSSTWQTCAEDLTKLLINNDRVFNAYTQALRRCSSWENGNILAKAFPGIHHLSAQQIDELIAAYNETTELQGSFAFNGKNKIFYGTGLVDHLNRLGTRQFRFAKSGLIETV